MSFAEVSSADQVNEHTFVESRRLQWYPHKAKHLMLKSPPHKSNTNFDYLLFVVDPALEGFAVYGRNNMPTTFMMKWISVSPLSARRASPCYLSTSWRLCRGVPSKKNPIEG